MTVKFSNTSNPRTFLAVADAAARTLPNSEWALGCVVVLDGNLADTANEGIITTGGQNATGSFRLVINTGISQPEINTFLNNSTSGTSTLKFTPVANKGYLIVVQRGADNVMRTKMCPVLTTAPTDGSAVVTSTIANPTLGTTIAGQGVGVSSVPNMIIGERAGDQRLNHSMARVFRVDTSLTDFEIAKLAYGMEITDLGKTPVWYYRLNDGADTADLSQNKYATTTSASPLPAGTLPGFGYVSVNSPPTVTAPTVPTPVQSGTTVTAVSGEVAGYPYPTITWQWVYDGADISGATSQSYIPTPAQVTTSNKLAVRQTVTSSQGTARATSAAVPVAAASNAIYVTPPDNERIFQRSGTSAVVPFSGTYTGTQPTTIEMQTYLSDGVTVARPWFNTAATIAAGGTWTANINMPQTAEKVRPQVRGKDASGNVIGQASAIHANRLGVGDLIAFLGSSSAETWDAPVNGTTPVVNTVSRFKDSWGVYTTKNYADTMAATIAAKAGVVVGILPYGVGGTSMDDWNVTDRLGVWSSFVAGVNAAGGKLAGLFATLGSNDAAGGPGNVQSHASHLAKIRLTISRVRSLTNQSTLPILWSGYNRRTAQTTGMTQAQFDTQSNYVRMAENEVGDDANVYHVQALDYELSSDGIHLTTGAVSGYMACAQRMAYVWNAAIFDGVYKRGPKITSLVASGSTITGTVTLRGGDTDFMTPLSKTGFAVTDASGTPGITSVTRIDATHFSIACDRALVSPVQVTYLAGSAPPVDGAIYGNSATPLPMNAETEMATTYSDTAPAPDTTAPVMSGSTNVTNVTMNSATVAWTAATDNVGISSYERTLDGGTTWVNVGTGTSMTLGSLTPSTTYSGQVRAIDSSNNRSNALPFSFTTAAAPDLTAPTLTNATATQTGQTTASGSVTTNEAGGTLYRMVSVNASESAATVKAGSSSTVTAAGVQSVAFTGLTAGTTYYPHYLHRDGAGNDSAVANGPAFTTASASTNPAPGSSFVPSAVRTIKAKADSLSFEGGRFWNLANPLRPVGRKDPDSTIDITMDWTDVLADIKDTIALASFIPDGVTNVATRADGALTTVFVNGGQVGGQASVTFRITTASNPPRIEDRTVYLSMVDE